VFCTPLKLYKRNQLISETDLITKTKSVRSIYPLFPVFCVVFVVRDAASDTPRALTTAISTLLACKLILQVTWLGQWNPLVRATGREKCVLRTVTILRGVWKRTLSNRSRAEWISYLASHSTLDVTLEADVTQTPVLRTVNFWNKLHVCLLFSRLINGRCCANVTPKCSLLSSLFINSSFLLICAFFDSGFC